MRRFIFATIVAAFILLLSAVSVFVVTPIPANAQDICATNQTSIELKNTQGFDLGYCEIKNELPKSNITDIGKFLSSLITLTSWVIGILALFGIIITGYMFITAGGDAERAEKAKKNLGWIIIGLIIFMLSLWAPSMLREIINDLPNTKNPQPSGITSINDDFGEFSFGTNSDTGTTNTNSNATTSVDLSPVTSKRVLGAFNETAVTIENSVLSPRQLTISEGTAVTWQNYDEVGHGYIQHPNELSSAGGGKFYIPPKGTLMQFYSKPGEFNFAEVDDKGAIISSGRITITENTQITTPTCPTQTLAERQITAVIGSTNISPSVIPVDEGTTITWENRDNKVHTITADDYRSTTTGPRPTKIEPGKSVSHTFTTYGQFIYLDEADPAAPRYAICVYPPEKKP